MNKFADGEIPHHHRKAALNVPCMMTVWLPQTLPLMDRDVSIKLNRKMPATFQPTPSLRGSTRFCPAAYGARWISIHDPLADGDCPPVHTEDEHLRFNPHHPYGWWPSTVRQNLMPPQHFNPHHPCGWWLYRQHTALLDVVISTHTIPANRGQHPAHLFDSFAPFQSSLSSRGSLWSALHRQFAIHSAKAEKYHITI